MRPYDAALARRKREEGAPKGEYMKKKSEA